MTHLGSESGRTPALDDVRSDLIVQEYVSLRNESLGAKQNQQTILQWSLATIGVGGAAVFATTAVFIDAVGEARAWLLFIDALVLGFAIPTLVACAFGIWLGEVERMERAGRYLRARENAINGFRSSFLNPDHPDTVGLLMWENVLANSGPGSVYQKNKIGSVASCVLFAGLYTASAASSLLPVLASDALGAWMGEGWKFTWVIGLALYATITGVLFLWRIIISLRNSEKDVADTSAARSGIRRRIDSR